MSARDPLDVVVSHFSGECCGELWDAVQELKRRAAPPRPAPPLDAIATIRDFLDRRYGPDYAPLAREALAAIESWAREVHGDYVCGDHRMGASTSTPNPPAPQKRWCSRCGDELSPDQRICDDECATGASERGEPTTVEPKAKATPPARSLASTEERARRRIEQLRPVFDLPSLDVALAKYALSLESALAEAKGRVEELETVMRLASFEKTKREARIAELEAQLAAKDAPIHCRECNYHPGAPLHCARCGADYCMTREPFETKGGDDV